MSKDAQEKVKVLQDGLTSVFEQAASELKILLPEVWESAMGVFQHEGQTAEVLLKRSRYFDAAPAEYAARSAENAKTVANYYDALQHGVYM